MTFSNKKMLTVSKTKPWTVNTCKRRIHDGYEKATMSSPKAVCLERLGAYVYRTMNVLFF